jgi:hypothetical protein
MRQTTDFEAFREDFLARHDNPMTDTLSTVGSALFVAGLGVAAIGQGRAGVRTALAGVAVAAIAHLFPPVSLRDEAAAILRHPSWALRSEIVRVRRGKRAA